MKRMELKRITAHPLLRAGTRLFAAGLVMGAAPGRAEVKEVWVGASGMTCGT